MTKQTLPQPDGSPSQSSGSHDSATSKWVMKIILCIGCICIWCCANLMAFILLPRSISVWVMLGGCYFMWKLWRRDSNHLMREHERSVEEILPRS